MSVIFKEVDFAVFPCPNCVGGHGKGRGMTSSGLYSCAMPSCKVCAGYGKCYICYGCVKVTIGVNYGDRIACNECKSTLKCNSHNWVQSGNELSCENCGTVRLLSEKSCSSHEWSSTNGRDWSCKSCGKKAA